MRIFLVGYMGSGKTRAGKLLAKGLGYEFMDIDHLFEEKFRISIQDFFKKYGEEAFRKLERDLLEETISQDNMVYSMGGGTPCFYNNMEMLNHHGTTVYIKMSPAALFSRLLYSKQQRPLLHSLSPEELLTHIQTQLSEREPIYAMSSITVDGINLNTEELMRKIIHHQTA